MTFGSERHAAFLMGSIASVAWLRIRGTVTFAFKRQAGLPATVIDEAAAAALEAKRCNYMGRFATRNAEFVREYLRAEHIPIVAEDLLGIHPRKVWFFPQTGRVVVQRLPHAHEADVAAAESAVRARLSKAPVTGGVELF